MDLTQIIVAGTIFGTIYKTIELFVFASFGAPHFVISTEAQRNGEI